MDLGELRDFVKPAVLKFAIAGKRYEVAPASGEAWVKLELLSAKAAGATIEDAAEIEGMSVQELRRLVLGPTHTKLVKDKVSGPDLQRAFFTAYLWQMGADSAVVAAAWQDAGGEGKASPPRRRKPTSTSTGAATTTRRRASTSGTSSRRKSSAA